MPSIVWTSSWSSQVIKTKNVHIVNTDEYADTFVTGQRMQHGFSAISPVVFPPLRLLGQLSSVHW